MLAQIRALKIDILNAQRDRRPAVDLLGQKVTALWKECSKEMCPVQQDSYETMLSTLKILEETYL